MTRSSVPFQERTVTFSSVRSGCDGSRTGCEGREHEETARTNKNHRTKSFKRGGDDVSSARNSGLTGIIRFSVKRVVLVMLVLVLALPVGFWLVLTVQARSLANGVVTDARELDARTFTLTGNEPGNVIECLGRAADVSPDLSRHLPWTDAAVMAVTSGSLAFSALSEEARAEIEGHRAWVGDVVACGKLATVAPAGGLGAFADIRHGRRQSMPRLMESLTSLSPLLMRDALAHGRADEALELCGATLTVTTAWMRLEGLEAMLPTLGPVRAVDASCGDALDAASVDARTRFARRIREIAALAPDGAEMMRLERTSLALQLFGAWMPAKFDAMLPASAKLITADQRADPWTRGFAGTIALRLYWRKFDRGMREVETAAKLPSTERDAAIIAAQQRLAAPLLRRFLASDPMDLRYQMYAGYLDTLQARFDALRARAE